MKTLKDIIRKNLNLISESEPNFNYLERDKKEPSYNQNYVIDYTDAPNEYKIARQIFYAFNGWGSNFEEFKSALEQIKNKKMYDVVEKYFESFLQNKKKGAEYSSIIDAINAEAESDNQEDIDEINKIIGPKLGMIINGGWDKDFRKFSKWTWGVHNSKSTPNTKNDSHKNTPNTKNDSNKNTSGSVINNDIKDIQTMISKTQYANVLPTKRSSTGIDGYWGKRTSQALLSLLNDYENKTKNNNNNFEFSNLTKKDF